MTLQLIEIAEELNKTPQETIDLLKKFNIFVKNEFDDVYIKDIVQIDPKFETILNEFYTIKNIRKKGIIRTIGVRVTDKYEEIINQSQENFKHFIDCDISPDICPMLWEELTPTDDKNKRYCKICKNFVFKVDDEETLKKLNNTDKCLAISNKLLEELYGKNLNENSLFEKLYIIKLFLIFKTNDPTYWNKISNLSKKEQVNKIIEFIKTNKKIKLYKSYGIDITFIQNNFKFNKKETK